MLKTIHLIILSIFVTAYGMECESIQKENPLPRVLVSLKESVQADEIADVYNTLDLFRSRTKYTVSFINTLVDNEGNTLLHYANKKGNESIIYALLESGANETLRNKLGQPALSEQYYKLVAKAKETIKNHQERIKDF